VRDDEEEKKGENCEYGHENEEGEFCVWCICVVNEESYGN
jgi:hypothetical protein